MTTTSFDAQLHQAYIAFFNRPADPSGFSYWQGQAVARGINFVYAAFGGTAEYTSLFTGQNNDQIVNTIYTNLFGRSVEPAGLRFWSDRIGNGQTTVGNAAIEIARGAQGTDATIIANKTQVATAFTAAVDTTAEILAYAGASANAQARALLSTVTADAATVTSATAAIPTTVSNITTGVTANGTTFALTTGADNIVGTSANDTINGYFDATASAPQTFTAADVINGGAGIDTLNLTLAGTGAVIPPAAVTGVEVVNLRAVGVNLTSTNLATFSGLTNFNSDRSDGTVTVTGAATSVKFGIIGDGVQNNGNVSVAYASAPTTVDLTVSGGTKAATFTNVTAGATTVNITSSGSTANALGAMDFGAASTVTQLTINASANFTTTDLGDTANEFAANAKVTATGTASTVNIGTLDSNILTVDGSGLTAGGITATMSAATQTITGGSGNDVITTGAVVTTGGVAAGNGTGDRLIVADSTHITSALGARYTGFEQLQANNNVAVNAGHVAGITSVRINDAAGTTSITNLSSTQAGAVTVLAAAGAVTIGVANATNPGQIDTVKMTIDNGTTGVQGTGTADFSDNSVIAGVENIEIVANDGFNISSMTSMTAVTSLKVSGAGAANVVTGAVDFAPNTVFDFSSLTGAATVNAGGAQAGATATALSISTGTGADAVTSTVKGDLISTAAGNDTVTSSGGADTITTGAGADSVVATQFNDASASAYELVLRFTAGDSISTSGAAQGIGTSADVISAIDSSGVASSGSGTKLTLDTVESATAVTATTTAVTLGTTTVTNAFDFYVYVSDAATVYVYQDTDGDKLIEAGEFAVQLLAGAQSGFATAEFTVASGNLLFTSA